jgi:hypothetical protein
MQGDHIFAYALKVLFLVTSPITFIVGIFLLYDVETYLKLEKFLAKSYGASKKTVLQQLEKNRESLQLFLIRRRRLIGFICLFNSVLTIFIVIYLLRR